MAIVLVWQDFVLSYNGHPMRIDLNQLLDEIVPESLFS